MIVDRIFDSAPRPFEPDKVDREYLSYEDFIYFMLSGKDDYLFVVLLSLVVMLHVQRNEN